MSFISSLKNIAVACSLTAAITGSFAAFSGAALAEGDFNNPSDKKLMCQYYANEADFQARENNRMGCGGTGNRWGEGVQGHYNWCMTQRDTRVINTEVAERTSTVKHCNRCNDWANARNDFEKKWTKLQCHAVDSLVQMDRFRGAGTTSHKLLMFSCMSPRKSTTQMDKERANDQIAFQKCEKVVTDAYKPKKKFALTWSISDGSTTVTKTGDTVTKTTNAPKPIKSTGKPKSVAPDQKSLQISSAIADIGDFYEPIAKQIKTAPVLKTYVPAPKPRTEMIVVGNRYLEVPAYSDGINVDAGRVIKASAGAVVLGTAAVATGAVAAKVLDYADDYEGGGGINKAASGAAEALKEKLKDRLDGGGINKAASGAVEAMKEKIKDGFQGGGINKSMSGAAAALKEKLKERVASGGGITKAMSGAKEALKYKLKERVAGGGLVSKAASGFKEKVKSRLTGGGGGLMKGMAKASGGVLRGLLRR